VIEEGKKPAGDPVYPKGLDAAIVAKLKSEFGNTLGFVEARLHTLVFRKPARGEYDIWRDASLTDKAQQSRHDRELACTTFVWPGGPQDQEALKAVLDDQPALLGVEIVATITSMAGLSDPVTVGKL
jgi:hypothetical protein